MSGPLNKQEREEILWALSCSTGGLDADGVREYMAPWVATVEHMERRALTARIALELAASLIDPDGDDQDALPYVESALVALREALGA